jgi:hypothetical protein
MVRTTPFGMVVAIYTLIVAAYLLLPDGALLDWSFSV